MGLVSDAMQSAGDIMRRLRNLEKDVRQLQTARRLESAAIGAGGIRIHGGGSLRLQGGGSIEVDDGGDIIITNGVLEVRDAEGRSRAEIGLSNGAGGFATLHAGGTIHTLIGAIESGGGNVGQGVLIQRPNGSDLFSIFASTETGNQEVRVFSHDGSQVFTTDKNGFGLDRPYIDVPMTMNNSTGDVRTDSATFSSRWIGRLRHTHPALHLQAQAWVSSPGALPTGEIRVTVNGTVVGSVETITSSTPGLFDFGADVHDLGALGLAHYGFYTVTMDARISANAGADRLVSVLPYGVTKRGSA